MKVPFCKQWPWFEVDFSDITMPILTSFDVDQKCVTQIIRISKMAALEQRTAIKLCVANKNQDRKRSKWYTIRYILIKVCIILQEITNLLSTYYFFHWILINLRSPWALHITVSWFMYLQWSNLIVSPGTRFGTWSSKLACLDRPLPNWWS